MVVIVTRDVPQRFRGFLASVMLEIAPGTYTAPSMSAGIRDRVWGVLEDWFREIGTGSIVMTWPDRQEPGGQGVKTLGLPSKEVVEVDGLYTIRAGVTSEKQEWLARLQRVGVQGSDQEQEGSGF